MRYLNHHTELLEGGGEVGLKVEGTSGGGLVTPIIVGGVGGRDMLLSLLYFINILPVVIMNVFYVS